jgi:nucleoside-diphosphate-sugar epimerase
MGRILVTGGAGFIGSNVAEYYAKKGEEVIVLDNLSRTEILGRVVDPLYNWNYLKQYGDLKLVKGVSEALNKLGYSEGRRRNHSCSCAGCSNNFNSKS